MGAASRVCVRARSVDVNGEPTSVPAGTSVAQLIAERLGDRRWLAVAIDGEVAPRSAWADTQIPAGADVEVLTAVQGG